MSLGFGFEYRGSPSMPVVTVIEPNGPAIAAGVQLGDTIWQVDGVEVPGLQVDIRELLINNNPEVRLTLQAKQDLWNIPGIGSLRPPQKRNVVIKRTSAGTSKQEPLLSPAAMQARDRGRAMFRNGQYEAAAQEFTRAMAGAANAYQLLTNRALCNQKLGRWGEVEADAREALRQSNASVKAHYLLGKALLELGKAGEAKQALLNSLSHSSSPEFKSYRGSIEGAMLMAEKRLWEANHAQTHKQHQALQELLTKMAEDCAVAAKAQGESASCVDSLLSQRCAAIDRAIRRATPARTPEQVPAAFICPLARKVMIDPVVTPTGQCYEREAIERHLLAAASDPLNPAQPLASAQLIANLSLKKAADSFLEQHPWAFDQELR